MLLRFLTLARLCALPLLAALAGCVALPKDTHSQYEKIPTGAGPEDLALDLLGSDSARLLISCNDHRLSGKNKDKRTPNGNIYSLVLDRAELRAEPMPRVGEPEGLDFHPHGIYLCPDSIGSKQYLYVVSHDKPGNKDFVYKYEVGSQALHFVRAYQSPLIYAPNSVAALPDGSFYIGNDKGKGKGGGGLFELLFRLRRSDIVYCDAQGNCVRVANKIAYANGLYIQDNHYLYLAATRHNRLFRYTIAHDGNLLDRQTVAKVVGGDNVRMDAEGNLYVAAHLRDLAFLAHYNKPENRSPSVLYRIAPDGSKTPVYAGRGEQISAAATGLPYGDYYYIGQVFEPFIIRVRR